MPGSAEDWVLRTSASRVPEDIDSHQLGRANVFSMCSNPNPTTAFPRSSDGRDFSDSAKRRHTGSLWSSHPSTAIPPFSDGSAVTVMKLRGGSSDNDGRARPEKSNSGANPPVKRRSGDTPNSTTRLWYSLHAEVVRTASYRLLWYSMSVQPRRVASSVTSAII